MRSILLPLFVFIFSFCSISQEYNPIVDDLVQQTNLDSLVKFTRELSGEDEVLVNGNLTLIQNRISYQNDMAAEYLKQKLTEFGLNPIEQQYSSNGTNIYAVQEGSVYPDEQYIICAHYDAVADYCADDDASGCVAVLESARLLANIDFEYTIIYAFWDEEEIGLIGSAHYANEANMNNDLINGVFNLEMFGWDSNNDMLIDIHTQNYANSVELANFLVNIDNTYELALDPVIHNPGTTASDHSSFWNEGYSAVVFSQAFFGGDSNPYYHTSQDRIQHFNLPYFHELSKLAVGAIASKATPVSTSIHLLDDKHFANPLNIFPNPVIGSATIAFNVDERSAVRIAIYNSLGQEIKEVCNSQFSKGNNTINFNANDMQQGLYIVRLVSSSGIQTSTIIVE